MITTYKVWEHLLMSETRCHTCGHLPWEHGAEFIGEGNRFFEERPVTTSPCQVPGATWPRCSCPGYYVGDEVLVLMEMTL